MSFVHLHVHTEYSMLDGASRIRELVSEAKQLGMPALAITDHGVLYGLIDFYEACQDVGVKPILGCELYLARESRFTKVSGEDNPKTIQHMTVLARDHRGYQNLLKLATDASLEGYYYKPRVDKQLLSEYSEGLIATTGCLNGQVPKLLLEGRVEDAYRSAAEWREIFGPENFFIELQAHGIADQDRVNPHLVEMSAKLAIPMIATNDLHYTRRDDAEAHDALLCIQTGATKDEPGRFRFDADEFYLKSRAEMEAVLGHYPQALDRTLDVAEMCEVKIPFGELQLPDFQPPDGSSLNDHLVKLTYEGAARLYGDPLPQQVRERLEYELGVILQMGFAGYFLIVADVMQYARSRGIRTGVRGSGASSCVGRCLGITTLDPLRYNLVFERFLNPERNEMPDVDLDFDERYRGEIIRYLRERYGEDRVAQVVTYSTIKGKMAIRDAARVLGYPYGTGDRLAKMFPRGMLGKDPSLQDCFERSSDPKWTYAFTEAAEMREAYQGDADSRRVLDVARKLEGLRRQTGVHAAAVVIGRDPLVQHTALQRTDNGDVVTQADMHGVEKLGLLKIDILGLSNLTVIDLTCDLVRRTRGVEVDIDAVPLDDAKVWEMLSNGESDGVFQLESPGMRRLLRNLRPDRFEDIVALIALYRPGPMGEIPKYIEGKHNPSKVRFPHELLRDVLEDTHGVIVYQEQVLQLLQRIAGYTPGEADIVRKAVGKKVASIMKAEEPKFLSGAAAHGLSEEQARHLWELIQPFAGYSFNRAHAACYGMVAYQTAYLKAHYPVEYLSALLTSARDSKDDKTKYLGVARRSGVQMLPPDVNCAELEFAPDPQDHSSVRFGLAGIRNVGQGVVEQILAARREGPFKDFFDFCWRVEPQVLNKRTIESLIKAGAFDSMGHPRGGLLEVFEQSTEQIASARRKEREGYVSLFDDPDQPAERTLVGSTLAIPGTELSKEQILAFEKEMLGHYVSDHPLLGLEQILACQTDTSIADLREKPDGAVVQIAGIVAKVGKKFTRKGELMLLLELEDLDATCEVVVFPAVAEKSGNSVEADRVVCLKGRIDLKDDDPKVVALEIAPPDLKILDRPIVITVDAGRCDERFVGELKMVLSEYPGNHPVLVHMRSSGRTTVLRVSSQYRVDPSNGCVGRLRLLLGPHGSVSA